MRYLILILALSLLACKKNEEDSKKAKAHFTNVKIDLLHSDSTSIRAIDVDKDRVYYAGSNGAYGFLNIADITNESLKTNPADLHIEKGTVELNDKRLAFRSIASTESAFFILSIESPAPLVPL